jgi:hypothetical protein
MAALVSLSSLRSQLAAEKSNLTTIDKELALVKETIQDAVNRGNQPPATVTAEQGRLIDERADSSAKITSLNNQIKSRQSANSQSAVTAALQNSGVLLRNTPNETVSQLTNTDSGKLEYNVPSVLDGYFSTRTSFLNIGNFSSNKPAAVSSAFDLWQTAKASKGMIVSYMPPTGAVGYQNGQVPKTAQQTYGKNYGFQFMYNPATISMDYTGTPNVDVALQTSGSEKFNLMGSNATQSTISFKILINRMFDMKYYNANGTLKPGAQKAYGGRLPSPEEQKAIFKMGTMYDVEYLLRTLLGYTLKSYLRDGNTADMGYLGARPVELHIGKNLRYLGTVTGVGLEHVIFNENMVPLFTNVSINFNRIPDYPIATSNR